MPPVQIADALWHCLCPSYSIPLIRPIRRLSRPLQACLRQRTASSATAQKLLPRTRLRQYHDDVSSGCYEDLAIRRVASGSFLYPDELPDKGPEEQPWLQDTMAPPMTGRPLKHQLQTDRERQFYKEWQKVGKTYLHKELSSRAQKGDKELVDLIVNILVQERHENLDARHYYALMLGNCCAERGSAQIIEELLEGMHKNEVPADSDIFHAALKVLAIHPDYLLRQRVLSLLEQYWFPLSLDGWQYLVVGLCRDRQYELALAKFQEMRDLAFAPEPWLLHFLITSFLSISAFPEALSMLQLRNQYAEPISSTIWATALSSAAVDFNYPVVDYVWRHAVSSRYLNPSSGSCTAVLAVAARYGDYRLATDVIRVLGQRNSAILTQHYESLYESYLAAYDLHTALSVLSIMTSTPTPLTESGASALFQYLLKEPNRPELALRILKKHRATDKPVSIVVVNTILDVLGHFNALPTALDHYGRLKRLVPEGPTTSTFNALLRGCYKSAAKDTAMFLAAEMRELKVKPDSLTYDRLILVCCKGKFEVDIDDGYKYWEEMRARGWWPRFGTVFQLVQGLTRERNRRVWTVLQENARRGEDSLVMRKWVNENWPRSGRELDTGDVVGDGEESDDEMNDDKEVLKNEEGKQKNSDRARGRGGKATSEEEFKQWNPLM